MSTMNREKIVSGLSTYLRGLARKRNTSVVSADDVHSFLDRNSWPRNSNKRLSIINTVLREPMFESAGSTPSSRPAAKGRSITTWELSK